MGGIEESDPDRPFRPDPRRPRPPPRQFRHPVPPLPTLRDDEKEQVGGRLTPPPEDSSEEEEQMEEYSNELAEMCEELERQLREASPHSFIQWVEKNRHILTQVFGNTLSVQIVGMSGGTNSPLLQIMVNGIEMTREDFIDALMENMSDVMDDREQIALSRSGDALLQWKRRREQGEGIIADVYHFFTGKYQGEKSLEKFLHKHGEARITSIRLFREPVRGVLAKAVDWLTKGDLQAQMEKNAYDKLFHLSMYMTLSDGSSITLEKNAAITTHEGKLQYGVEAQSLVVFQGDGPELRTFIYKAIQRATPKGFFVYDPFGKNCQDFVYNALKANDMLDEPVKDWIRQNLYDVASKHPKTAQFFQGITDVAGIVGGAGEGNRLEDLPVEIQERIFAELPPRDQVRMAEAIGNERLLRIARANFQRVSDPTPQMLFQAVRELGIPYEVIQSRATRRLDFANPDNRPQEYPITEFSPTTRRWVMTEGRQGVEAINGLMLIDDMRRQSVSLDRADALAVLHRIQDRAGGLGQRGGEVRSAKGTDNFQLEKAMKGVKGFKGVVPLDGLPTRLNKGDKYIINYQPISEGGSHWIGLCVLGNKAVVFDSFGAKPPEAVVALIKKSGLGLVANSATYQMARSGACGEFAVYFLAHTHDYDSLYKVLYEDLEPEPVLHNELVVKRFFASK